MSRLKFSIVIAVAPYRNAEVLKSLDKVNYPKSKYEVIVKRGLNPSENRNNGAKEAKGEIIGFIDDDAIVSADLLKNVERFFAAHKDADIVGGPQLTPLDEKGLAKISGYALSSKFGAWKTSRRYYGTKTVLDADETMLTSANLFCRKNVLKKVLFDLSLFPGEDPKFISDAKKSGLAVSYSPEITVYHRRRANIFGLMKQIYSYGMTRVKKESLKETLKMPFFFIPSIFILYILLLILFSILSGLDLILFSPLLAYMIISLIESLSIAISKKDIAAFFVLPFIFLAIHLSYGTGFMISLIKKCM